MQQPEIQSSSRPRRPRVHRIFWLSMTTSLMLLQLPQLCDRRGALLILFKTLVPATVRLSLRLQREAVQERTIRSYYWSCWPIWQRTRWPSPGCEGHFHQRCGRQKPSKLLLDLSLLCLLDLFQLPIGDSSGPVQHKLEHSRAVRPPASCLLRPVPVPVPGRHPSKAQ